MQAERKTQQVRMPEQPQQLNQPKIYPICEDDFVRNEVELIETQNFNKTGADKLSGDVSKQKNFPELTHCEIGNMSVSDVTPEPNYAGIVQVLYHQLAPNHQL